MNFSTLSVIIIKPSDSLKREDFLSKLKNDCPDDSEIERTKQIIILCDIENGEHITRLYTKTDIFYELMFLRSLKKNF